MIVLRLTRHEACEAQIKELRRIFGDDTKVVTMDIDYGSNILKAIEDVIADQPEPVVACDIIATWPQIAEVVGPLQSRGIRVIRAEMRRGPDGRVIQLYGGPVFSHWIELERVEIQTRSLAPPASWPPKIDLQTLHERVCK